MQKFLLSSYFLAQQALERYNDAVESVLLATNSIGLFKSYLEMNG